MFTGIVTDIGTIAAATQQGDLRVEVSTSYDVDTIDLGASISCSGVCLTVVDKAPGRVAFAGPYRGYGRIVNVASLALMAPPEPKILSSTL